MDLMLNAVEDDASGGENSPSPAPPAFPMPVGRISAGGGASLASILSAESPQTPNDAVPKFALPVARHAGLASLMNSPMGDPSPRSDHVQQVVVAHEVAASKDAEDAQVDVDMGEQDAKEGEEGEDEGTENEESPVKRRRAYSVASEASVSMPPPAQPVAVAQSPASVAVHADALVLHDAELEELKAALQHAVEKFLAAEAKASAPPSKRARKGKHQQKKRASQAAQADASTAVSESVEEVEQCVARLHDKIAMDLTETAVLRDVVRVSLVFLGIVNTSDPVQVSPSVDTKTALVNVQSKPVHLLFASTVRRVVMSVPEETIPLIVADVFEWVLTSGSEVSAWSWLFAFCAQFDSSAVIEFFIHHVAFQPLSTQAEQEFPLLVLVLEHLSIHHSADIVEAVTKTLNDLVETTQSVPVRGALVRLVTLGLRSPTLLRVVDDSFQWVFTRDLLVALWIVASSDSTATTNGSATHASASLFSTVLQLIDERSEDLENSIFQLMLLLPRLMENNSSETPEELAKIASKFHIDVLRIAQHQSDPTILRGIHRRLPYIAHSVMETLGGPSKSKAHELSTSRQGAWKSWLRSVASSISRRDVTDQLLQADLTLFEVSSSSDSGSLPVESLCDLLCSIVNPSSSDFVILLRELSEWLQRHIVSQSGQKRLLSVLERLLGHSGSQDMAKLRIIPVKLGDSDASTNFDAIVTAFRQMSPWQESWARLDRWRAASGAELWEYLLDTVADVDRSSYELAVQALALLAKTPFPSLEDPAWQFRCIRKLTTVYFYSLRRYRASVIDLDSSQGDQNEWRVHLETMRAVITRVCALDGAVAHYPSSVCSQLTSLWLDLLFSTASATSVPTHFPSSTKGDSGTLKKAPGGGGSGRPRTNVIEDQVVIRSERTISSKCTNLQSSQVITKHSDTLVYRKALDETWEREMHAALTCSVLATDVLGQLMGIQTGEQDNGKRSERRLKVLVDMLLERAIPCCGIPSDDVYKEFLPNRSSFDVDLRVEQWLNHFPAFLPLLRLVVDTTAGLPGSVQSLRLVPMIKSALVVLLGHWNSVKGDLEVENMDVPPYMRNRNQLALSCELLRILRTSGWLPEPLARTAELLPLTSPADIRGILFSCWFFLADHPPSSTAPASAAKMPVEFYVLPVRKALHHNIHKIGAKYPLFKC